MPEVKLSPVQEARLRRNRPTAGYRSRREQTQAEQPNYAVGVARAVGQGATFGFADEAEASIRALIDRQEGEDYGIAYRRIRDGVRTSNDAFSRENPVVSTVAEISGAIAVPGLATARAAGQFIGRGAGLAAQAGRAGAVGAAEGAVYGAGTANETSDIPQSMATGAAMGGAFGAAVPAALRGGQALVNTVRNAAKPEVAASARLAQALERDGVTMSTVRQRLRLENARGRPVTVADVAGTNTQRELERVAQSPGAGADRAVKFLETRSQDQLSRLSRDMTAFTGIKGDDVADVIDKTMKDRAAASAPVYERAMQFQAELDDGIVAAYDALIRTPLGKQAIPKARRILNVEDFDSAPLMDRIDAVKKGMDDLIGQAQRGGERQIARKAVQAKNELLELVDSVNPSYRQAREIWQDGQTYLDAIESGRDILKPNLTAAEAKRQWSDLSDVDREAWRIGAVDAIITRMRQQSAKEPNLIRILRSPEIRDKVKLMMSPRDAKRFDQMLDMEDTMFSVSSRARTNSATAQRLASREEAEKQARLYHAVTMITDLVVHGLRGGIMNGLTWLPRRARDTFMARQNEILAGQILTRDPNIVRLLGQAPRQAVGGAISAGPTQAATVAGSASVAGGE